jgi:hypothetical protein
MSVFKCGFRHHFEVSPERRERNKADKEALLETLRESSAAAREAHRRYHEESGEPCVNKYFVDPKTGEVYPDEVWENLVAENSAKLKARLEAALQAKLDAELAAQRRRP